ncbi:MAG: serine/threonine-protein kinase [Gemmatimonadetes bacterium]|nr:serine/threonine-protein kinase [Gemmatimonadota bacterium]MDA1102577.1 serine/threonine-protein kinase [Gemmatimonadota bacterium]
MNSENAPAAAVSNADIADQQAMDALRDALGHDFEIVRKLGKGSMASVYLAKEKALGRLVAIKVLLPGRANDETARRRFEREAKAAASLSHPNVVQVFRFGRLPDETPYLVMRFVKGRTMEERLQAEGRLPRDLARQVLKNVTSALAAAHAQGIVHRDIRPANILWDEESSSAHLTDFGIAALLATGGEEATRLTKTGQMVGDPRYLSPEQLLDQDLTELADMYAIGVLGYELYTGQGPYDAKTNTQWITAHLSATPKDLQAIRPDVEADVADLLKRCLNREPNYRPRAADAARVLGGDIPVSAVVTSGSVEDLADLKQLIKRRVPQIVLVAGAAALGFIQLIGLLVEMGSLGPIFWELSLPFAACGVAAATIMAWFHGEAGKQEANVLEWIMLSVIGVIWITISAWIVVGG